MTLGVLGGTFDPIHLGHLAAGDAAQQALSLDSMLLVPSRIPPHRADAVTAGPDDRFAMAQLAARERPGWTASRIELDREGPSFTYDTLIELKSRKRGDAAMSDGRGIGGDGASGVEWQIFFIIGADAFAEIASWSRYPAVLDLAHFVIVSRPGITLDSLRERVPSAFSRPLESARGQRPSAKTRVILVEAHTPAISSTDIRRRARAGHSLSGYVPDTVADYIRDHHLYLGPQKAYTAQK
jgi:nicotinate-nucleotide adenylyltransferase